MAKYWHAFDALGKLIEALRNDCGMHITELADKIAEDGIENFGHGTIRSMETSGLYSQTRSVEQLQTMVTSMARHLEDAGASVESANIPTEIRDLFEGYEDISVQDAMMIAAAESLAVENSSKRPISKPNPPYSHGAFKVLGGQIKAAREELGVSQRIVAEAVTDSGVFFYAAAMSALENQGYVSPLVDIEAVVDKMDKYFNDNEVTTDLKTALDASLAMDRGTFSVRVAGSRSGEDEIKI